MNRAPTVLRFVSCTRQLVRCVPPSQFMRVPDLTCVIPQSSAAAARKIVPLLDRVLVEKSAAQKTSAGGVLLPESALSKLNEGKVVAVGPGGRATDGTVIPLAVKAGDDVLLPEYGGSKVTVDGKELYLYRDDDLLGVIQK